MQRIKDTYQNIRRHWKVFGLLAISLFACYKLFFHFYTLRAPYILRSVVVDAYQSHNDLAACEQNLQQAIDDKRTAEAANNPDVFK